VYFIFGVGNTKRMIKVYWNEHKRNYWRAVYDYRTGQQISGPRPLSAATAARLGLIARNLGLVARKKKGDT